jgi:NAD(P)-dependent dehydrogenase (short-subunit alcohol dehydrogenase family)
MQERNWLPPESDRFHGSKKKTMTKRGSLSYDASASNTSCGIRGQQSLRAHHRGSEHASSRFLEKGYSVIGNSRAISASTHLTPSPRLALVDGDIGDCATAQKLTDTTIARFGRIDVLVNNAGLLLAKPFIDYTSCDFAALVSTTSAGFFHISQSAAKQMLRQQSGHIVNISTSIVDQPIGGVPCALHVLTKGGLHAVARALAIEYAGHGIRINTVALGAIRTPMHKIEAHGFLKSLQPIGRMGEIDEVVDAVMYLCDATFVTGEVLRVDGGAHAGKW